MAPIRRYLRITKYSVLECRIYLDNPALAQSWLLNPRKAVLPRVVEAVRPLVLPKLREERERARKRSTRKKGIKDVVVEDDFEVSIFLTETSTRHSLLTKHKYFHDTTQTKLTSNSGRLVGATSEAPIDVDLDAAAEPITLMEEDSDEDAAVALAAVPAAPAVDDPTPSRRPKRARVNTGEDGDYEFIPSNDDEDAGVDGSDHSASDALPPSKRRKDAALSESDDKKKLAMDIQYEGFSIYGRVLCLVVKRRDAPHGGRRQDEVALAAGASGNGTATEGGQRGQIMMENFIISTQVPAGQNDNP